MSTLYANFHHDRHRQTAGQHIQPEKKPRAVQMHAAKKIDAEHNPLIPADHHATASTHTNLRYAPSGFTLLPITDYAQEIMGTPDANRPARVKIRKPRRTGRPLKRSDSAARSVEILCSGLCLGIVEMFAGHRTLEQFRKWFSPSCCAELQALGQTIRSQRSQTRRTAPPRVLRSRAQKVDNAKGGYEVTLVVHDGVKVRAMAMRVIERYSTWHITTVEYR